MSGSWSGSKVRKARAHFLPLLPLPCARCGLPVTAEHRWHVGHQQDRALGGPDDLSNLWPEHGRCNEAAGGRLGAALRRPASRPVPRPVKRRNWL